MPKNPKTYFLLKLNRLIKNHRVKFLALWVLHKLNKRYLSVNFDPINACNLRCKMCYFTDVEYVKKLKGVFKKEDLPLWAETILPRALKLQVGCGTEPTLYPYLNEVFLLAKKHKVPHISLTTNANLLEKESLENWVQNGLNEIIVSLHGVHKETYEFFMEKASYEKFHTSMRYITEIKKQYPTLILRINYTFNEDNFHELSTFFEKFDSYAIDIIQLRPIRKLGNTAYNNFELNKITGLYPEVLKEFKRVARKKGITLLAPDIIQKQNERKNTESILFEYTYCYISPTDFWHSDFDWRNESYNAYCKRTGWSAKILKNVMVSGKKLEHLQTENLNYGIDLNGR